MARQDVVHLLDQYSVRLPWLSTSSARWLGTQTSTVDLLKHAVNDILCHTSQLAGVLKACNGLITNSSSPSCSILNFGPVSHEPELLSALRRKMQGEVKIYEQPSRDLSLIRTNQASRTARKSKLAIVGMAGRFPDAASHEALWELLEAGLDVHREVCLTCILALHVNAHDGDRCRKIVSTSKTITMRAAKSGTQVIPHMAASSKSQGCSILGSSTCRRERHYRRIRCTDLVSLVRTKHLRCPATSPIELLPHALIESVLFMDKLVMTGERSMQLRKSTRTSSLVEFEPLLR